MIAKRSTLSISKSRTARAYCASSAARSLPSTTAIHAAASFGRTEALTHLLKKCGATFPRKEGDPPPPAQLEVGTVDGLTPIMKAAQMGQQQSVELLIKFGAEVNAVDNQAMSALDWAEKTDRKPIVDVLKKANGDCSTSEAMRLLAIEGGCAATAEKGPWAGASVLHLAWGGVE